MPPPFVWFWWPLTLSTPRSSIEEAQKSIEENTLTLPVTLIAFCVPSLSLIRQEQYNNEHETMSTMLYQRVPSDLTETSFRGRILSILAAVSIGTLFILETRAYFFSKTLETDLSLLNPIHNNNYDTEPYIRLNFDITMMDLPCEHATIDVYSAIGYQKNITRNIRKYPIDGAGVRQRYEARNWHQNDIELWDPAIVETIDDLHHDGEDAISLDANSFPYGEQE